MSEDESRNEQAPGHPKEASATVYLVEELGDARLRCDQLVRYVAEGIRLVESSPQKEKFHETAGHLIQAVPLTLFKLQKSLQAVALAANRIDYDELRTELRPEKVQQLETVLEDVRIRQINRHSEPLMTPQQVAAKLRQIATTTRDFALPQDEVVGLIATLERGQKTADEAPASRADMLDKFADVLEAPHEKGKEPSRLRLAAVLRRMVGDVHVTGHLATLVEGKDKQAIPPSISAEDDEKEGRDKQAIPPSIAGKKAAAKVNLSRVERNVNNIVEVAKSMKSALDKYKKDPGKMAPQLENVGTDANSVFTSAKGILRALGRKVAEEDKQTRFEEGKPADPTKNMTEEEAKEWKAQTEKHKDKFKGAKFEKGEDADKDNDGAPDNLKGDAEDEWKANTEKHKDKFKKKEAASDWKAMWREGLSDGRAYRTAPEKVRGEINKSLRSMVNFGTKLTQYGNQAKQIASSSYKLGDVEELLEGASVAMGQIAYHAAKVRNMSLVDGSSADVYIHLASDDDWKAPEARAVTAALKPKDKKVVDAFYEKESAEGYLLSTDGKKLSKHGMGGGTFAEWKSGKIHIVSPGGNKSHDDILRYMKKSIPRGSLADHPQLRSATEVEAAISKADWKAALKIDQKALRQYEADLKKLQGGGKVPNLTVEGAKASIEALKEVVKHKQKLISKLAEEGKQTKFKEGEPADPTKDMSKEEAAEWKANTKKYEDKFKKDANMLEGQGIDPEHAQALHEAGKRNHEAIFGDDPWKA